MPLMLQSILLFALGLILLIKGGDWFVDGATGIARRSHLPDVIIGATVVSIGTTLPEVMVSTTGALQGQSAMAYGNAIGSIICNTALIAAISITFAPAPTNAKTLRMPVLFFFGCAAVYCVAAYALGEFSRWVGILLLAIFLLYIVCNIYHGLRHREPCAATESEALHDIITETKQRPLPLELLMLVGGAAVIAIGADLLVDNGTLIAAAMGVPETVIALTFVALGTSLPELITTITSLRKGHASLGIGNVIGANVMNLALVSGLSVTLAPFAVPTGKLIFGHSASLILDIPLMLAVMALLTVPAITTKKLHRWQGIILLTVYAAFCTVQFCI